MARINTQQLTESFGLFKDEVTETLDTIGNHLDAGEYAAASERLNVLTERVAKTNLAVRTVLIRGGLLATPE